MFKFSLPCALLSLIFGLSATLPSHALDLHSETLNFQVLGQQPTVHGLYHASQRPEQAPENPSEFIQQLTPAKTIDRVGGGAYWVHLELHNRGDSREWVLDTKNAVIDTIRTFYYPEKKPEQTPPVENLTGYLHPLKYYLHYGIDFTLDPGESAQFLVFMDSRYYSGEPTIQIASRDNYRKGLVVENSWIIACMGAVLVLALYNLFIASYMRDRSYFYYSTYLTVSLFAWAAAMNLLSWFEWRSYHLLIPPFFLAITFNLLYIIHFLELNVAHKRLSRFAYLLTGFTAFMGLFGSSLMSPGLYQQAHALSALTWVGLGLWCGVIRLREGYKPARYFVAAFVVLVIGIILSVATSVGMKPVISNTFLATLIAQTIDMLLLSLALADRINVLREEKESALKTVIATESRRRRSESHARKALATANDTLLEALEISEKESERKSNFLRMVSHELRTPLHSITAAFRQWDNAGSDDEQQDILDDINYGTLRLCTQIDNLVLMAETDDDKLEAQSFPFEIAPMLDKLCQRTEEQIKDKDVHLIHNRSAFLPHGFQGDAYLISHLIRAVLDNACKFTTRGEIVFDVDWNEESQSLDILLMDDGCGMSDEQQKVVFDGFIQVSRGLTRQSEGLGLGLTLGHRIADILDASLAINSTVGDGTEINLHIPLKKLVSPSLTFAASDYRGAVLIVEDNLVNAKVLERMVVKMGHPADVAHSGLEALAAVEKRTYAVILMDVQMPDMDGISATTKIRERNVHTPIIAVTANSDSDVRRDCRHAGMNDFLVKPVSPNDVQMALASWQQVTPSTQNRGNLH